jgi:hypothetical protein
LEILSGFTPEYDFDEVDAGGYSPPHEYFYVGEGLIADTTAELTPSNLTQPIASLLTVTNTHFDHQYFTQKLSKVR